MLFFECQFQLCFVIVDVGRGNLVIYVCNYIVFEGVVVGRGDGLGIVGLDID